jgi:hypothetical protein
VGVGLLFALVTRPPQALFLLPAHTLRINLPAASADRSFTLEYATTSLRDISFDEFELAGEWQRTEAGISHSGGEPASINWIGRTGDSATLVFTGSSSLEGVILGWNDDLNALDTARTSDGQVTFLSAFPAPWHSSLPTRFIIGFTFGFLFLILSLFLAGVELHPAQRVKQKKGAWLLYTLPMIAVWGLFLLTFFPGMMSNDSSNQWNQIVTHQFDDTHPVLHTLIMWLITRVWFSPAAVASFQILALSLTVAWGINLLDEQGLPGWAGWVLSVVFALFPLNGDLVITLWKDILYSTSLLLFSLIILKIIFSHGEWLQVRFSWLILGTVGLFVGSLRHNGFPIPLLSIIILIVVFRRWWKQLASAMLLFLVLTLFIRGPLYSVLGVDRQNEAVERLLAHHIAAHVVNIDSQPSKIAAEMRQLFDMTEFRYDCCSHIPSAVTIQSGFGKFKTSQLIQSLFPALVKNDFMLELQHQICATSFLWEIPSRCSDTGLLPYSSGWISQKYIQVEEDSQLPFLLPFFIWLTGLLRSNDSTVGLISPSIYVILGILYTGFFAFRNRDPRFLLFLMPAVINTLILMVINFTSEYRLQYGVILVGLFSLGLFILALCTPKELQPGKVAITNSQERGS